MHETTLTFCGGAGSVTGSNFLFDTGGTKLLVDCGMQQGMHEDKNWAPFAYDPADISHLIITHAHIDHIGRIPRLVRQGFKGVIISTQATHALTEPLLLDAMQIANHHAVRDLGPLYDEHDVAEAMKLWRGIGYHEKMDLPDGITLELLDAGHILGSAMVRLEREGRVLVVTGDLGGGNSPLIGTTEEVSDAHYVLMESVYGDRTRPEDKDRREQLENIIEDAARRGGTLLIPAFSTERTQDLLYEIRLLMTEGRVPSTPVFVDSPLAQKITEAFVAHPQYFAPEIRARVEAGERIFSFEELQFVEGAEASRKLDEHLGHKIIIAGSGMSVGGRVIGHERRILPDENSTLLIVGYQAVGSLGRKILDGAKEVMIYKEKVPVRCKVEVLYGYSAHRDGEALLEFANVARGAEHIYVVEGEPAASSFLAQRIRDYLATHATAPEEGSKAVLKF
jgi:metallo-beta-lactamase family protein